jgi:hypothetical protein
MLSKKRQISIQPSSHINSLVIECIFMRKSPLSLFAREGHYPSLWQREVRKDFIKLKSSLLMRPFFPSLGLRGGWGSSFDQCHHISEILRKKNGKATVSSSSAVTLKLILKFIYIIDTLIVVIPAKAEIHVFRDFQWTPAFAGVPDSLELSILR